MMTISERSLAAAMRRYPTANRERVRAWWAASPEPTVSVARKRAAARLVLEAAAKREAA